MAYRLMKVDGPFPLTEAALEEMEALPSIPGERDLRKAHLKWMWELIEKQEFNRCDWATCFCKEDKKLYRSDGQHSTKTLRRSVDEQLDDYPFPSGIPVTIKRAECDSLTELADVFDWWDHHKSARNAEDKLGIYMAQHKDLIGINKEICGKVLAGIQWGIRHIPTVADACGDNAPGDAYERGRLLAVPTVREFVDFMHQQSGAPFREWKQKSGIVATMFDIFLSDREDAELAIEQTMYEAGNTAADFTRKIRQSCARTGKDQGYYYRQTERYFRSLFAEISSLGKDAIKKMIREVMDEDNTSVA